VIEFIALSPLPMCFFPGRPSYVFLLLKDPSGLLWQCLFLFFYLLIDDPLLRLFFRSSPSPRALSSKTTVTRFSKGPVIFPSLLCQVLHSFPLRVAIHQVSPFPPTDGSSAEGCTPHEVPPHSLWTGNLALHESFW